MVFSRCTEAAHPVIRVIKAHLGVYWVKPLGLSVATGGYPKNIISL